MQVGIDRFSGDKLREALDYRSVSQKRLAADICVHPSNVTKYIKGTAKPKAEVFEKLSFSLQFPKEYFFSDTVANSSEPTSPNLWRSLKSATKRARNRGEVILRWQKQLYQFFSQHFDYPAFQSSEFEVRDSFDSIDFAYIDEFCLKLREQWGLGDKPIGNLIRTLECHGICVCQMNLSSKRLDAVSSIRDGVPLILLNSSVNASGRMRFNVAHELGHILLHQSVSEEDLEDESIFAELEEQAHYFASSLLLPEKGITNDLWAPTLKCMEGVKKKWNISIQAIMRRSLELGLITLAQFGYLNIALSRKGWRTVEPFDDVIPTEYPRLFSQSLERINTDHGISATDVRDHLQLPSVIAAELCSVEAETFLDSSNQALAPIIKFAPPGEMT